MENSDTTLQKKPVSFANLAIGAILNLMEVTSLGQPFEVIKTHQAANRNDNVITAVKKIYASGGISRFWNGLIPWAWIEASTKGAVLFFVASELEYVARAKFHMSQSAAGMLAGVGGGISQAYLTMGITTFMKTTMITGAKGNTFQIARDIFKKEGIRGLNKGVNAVALRQATNWGLRIGAARFAAATMEKMQKPEDKGKPLSAPKKILAGIIGGVIGCLNQPIEVIRVEMQSKVKDPNRPAKMTIMNTAKYIYEKNGIKGFYRGIVPRLGLSTWQTLFLVTAGDEVKKWWAARVGGTVSAGH